MRGDDSTWVDTQRYACGEGDRLSGSGNGHGPSTDLPISLCWTVFTAASQRLLTSVGGRKQEEALIQAVHRTLCQPLADFCSSIHTLAMAADIGLLGHRSCIFLLLQVESVS